MRLKKRLNHRVPFPEPVHRETDRKPFLAIIAIILLVSFIGVLNHLEKEAITGSAVQTIGFVKEGKEVAFEVKTAGINSATIHLTEDTKNAKIVFEEQAPSSPNVNGPIYSVVKVSSDKPVRFSTLDIYFKINENELINKGIAVHDFQLYVNDQPVETTLSKKVDGYIFYIATTTTFGDYVLAKRQEAKPAIEEAADTKVTEPVLPPEETSQKEEVGVVGKAIQQPSESNGESFWQNIKNFFSNFWG
ncbi:hypothetical protein HYT55_05820 [Candidatus Woesearchaeota archaeon]|nr:hypothetical protein [Candidatus Woesearchaeota archaeon]